jgi:hypothetical protein
MAGSQPALAGDIDDQAETPESQVRISIFLGLLILTVFVLPSFGLGEDHGQLYSIIVSSVLYCSGISIGWHSRRLFLSSLLIVVVAIFAKLCALLTPSPFWMLWSEAASLAATLTISLTLLLQIFRSKGPVTRVSIQAAIAAYLLFGTAWANAYVIAMQQNPKSFHSTVALSVSSSDEWLYYSFVTLTTLGYGEITPLSQVARSLAVGEALTGQLYMAVLIGRLIGKEISSRRKLI